MTIQHIIDVVFKFYHIDPLLCHAKTRKREIAQTRQIAMYFGRELTKLSFASIGKEFNMNHATILYGADNINDLIETDKKLAREVQLIRLILKGRQIHFNIDEIIEMIELCFGVEYSILFKEFFTNEILLKNEKT